MLDARGRWPRLLLHHAPLSAAPCSVLAVTSRLPLSPRRRVSALAALLVRVARTDGTTSAIATVAFDSTSATGAATAPTTKRRKRWAALTSTRGRLYYHNTETGEDRWDEPPDVAADAVEDAFGPCCALLDTVSMAAKEEEEGEEEAETLSD